MKRPSVPTAWQPEVEEGLSNLFIGTVVSAVPSQNRARVRLSGSSGRTVSNVVPADGLELQQGQRVLLAHTRDDRWVAVARILDTDEYGLLASSMIGEHELHPPNNFDVTGTAGLVLAEWDCWAGNSVCWDVEHNSSATSVGATTFYTRGGYFLYPAASPTTRFVRVRAVRYDVGANVAYFSRWSSWGSATSLSITGASGEIPVVGGAGHPHFRVDGPIATGTSVGGKWRFNAVGGIYGVGMCLKNYGSSGRTRVDVNLNGVSLWLLETMQPTIAVSDPSECIIVSGLTISEVASGQVMTLDIDEAAPGAIDLDVIVYMLGSSEEIAEHAHSGGPHTGTLDFDELQYNGKIIRLAARQGGDGTNWSIAGTNNYTISGGVLEQVGAKSVAVPGLTGSHPNKHKTKFSVTFPTSYSNVPHVTVSALVGDLDSDDTLTEQVLIRSVTTSGFEGYGIIAEDVDRTFTVLWRAVGNFP